jgi:serpin B
MFNKKRSLSVSLVVAVAVLARSTGVAAAVPASGTVEANNAFAIDLFTNLADAPGNLVVCPFSVAAVLGVVQAGARGETARQIANTLHLSGSAAAFHQDLGRILKDAATTSELSTANSLWIQEGIVCLPTFEKTIRDEYGARLIHINFGDAAVVQSQANAWVASETHGMIRQVSLPVPADQRAALVANATFFSGRWSDPFRKWATQDSRFWVAPSNAVAVPMMHKTSEFRYFDAAGFKALQIPYLSNALSMVIILPETLESLRSLEKTLTAPRLQQVLQSAHYELVELALPRFKCSMEINLTDRLAATGITDAFSPAKADFSGISPQKPLWIQGVIHQTYMEVDEEGTRVAAATIVGLSQGMEKTVDFTVDRPFLFLIRHEATGAILFLGRVANPKQ